MSSWSSTLDLDKRSVHDLLEEDEHGVTADPAAICRATLASEGEDEAGFWRADVPRDKMRSGGPLVVSFRRTPEEASMATEVLGSVDGDDVVAM
jgi:hypothetical protein